MGKQSAPSHTTALDVANYIIKRAGKERRFVDPMQLQKLVYFSQCWHLAEYGAPLFDDPIEAWTWGPVVRNVWKAYSGRRPIVDDDVYLDELDDNAMSVIESVWCAYGHLSGPALSKMTHREGGAWRKARKGIGDGEQSAKPITSASMRQEVSDRLAKRREWMNQNWDRLVELADAP